MKNLVLALACAVVLAIPLTAYGVAPQTYQTRANWTGGLSGGNMTFWDDVIVPNYPTNSMWVNCPILAIQQDPYVGMIWWEDFEKFTAGEWTITETGAGGTSTLLVNGYFQLLTDALDNDNQFMQRFVATVVVGPTSLIEGDAVWFEAKISVTAAAANQTDLIIGLADDDTTPLAFDDGGAFFRVVDEAAALTCVTEDGTVETITATLPAVTLDNTGVFHRYGFYYDGATTGTVRFFYDGVQVASSTTNLPNHAMVVHVAIQNGQAGAQTLVIDYIKVAQIR